MISVFFAPKEFVAETEALPVGYPVEDLSIRLVDGGGRDVGQGEIGEIVVEGEDFALEYHNDPGRTAAAFQPVPGSARHRYRTGDLGRINGAGLLEHRGRTDFRVKVRGFAVEIETVEAALRTVPGISDAVVVQRTTGAAEQELVAYLAVDRIGPRDATIRRALVPQLPAHALPARFVRLDGLPQTAAGKVNRFALRDWPLGDRVDDADEADPAEPEGDPRGAQRAAPLSPTERALVEMCGAVLAVPTVSPDDGFLALGGDSVSAMQIISRIRTDLGCDVSVRTLFETDSLRELARHIEARRRLP
jgi:acyl carrier protein